MKKKSALLLLLVSFIIMISYIGSLSMRRDNEIVGKVLRVDNSRLIKRGVGSVGEQKLTLKITGGEDKGETIEATNRLNGDREYDEFYSVGDRVVAGVLKENGKIIKARALTTYRFGYLIALFSVFAGSLILYSGTTGIKSLLSFFMTVFFICKYMIPRILDGQNPLLVAMLTLILLTCVIIFSIGGLNRRGVSAFAGAVTGLGTSVLLTYTFMRLLNLDGFTLPMAQGLLMSGNFTLNFREIYFVSIIIGASGAAMDIAMDIASSIEELRTANPEITRKELLKASFNIGNAVVGTMSTTLLLAYSGGNITLMMYTADRGLPLFAMLNGKIMAAEIARTLIGTISLIMVAPSTAILSIFIYEGKRAEKIENNFKVQADI
ncbi:YibE/F family protein [uncultured Ilyobacter sp.]|uniref:YibE/F family protein n=1 Tax=uncultured Ilyobacter sp. TaxID=544433 RepID=UPI0029C0E1E7|nr:YibE/F family protein [uncultured Ilyobacter sp.]